MICFPWGLYLHTIFLWCSEKQTPNNKHRLGLVKRRSKVQEMNISSERVLNFDQWKKRVWFWLFYRAKFTENNCLLWLFSKFIETQKRYTISLDKISILQSVTKIVRLAPLAPLFNVGCKFAWLFLATTAWHSFFRLGTTLSQGVAGIMGIF